MTNPVATDMAPLPLTTEQKQEVKEKYLQDYPGPGINGLDDITAFHSIMREMGHSPYPSWDRATELLGQYEETGVMTPGFQEMIDSVRASDALYWELFPNGLRGEAA